MVFGDGPDGAREATFDGRIPFPSGAAPWDGYGVLQAKFLQRSSGVGRDGKWAVDQLTQELRKFTDRKRRLRKPDYYIFATNVVLSPVAGRGYKDQVNSTLRNFQKRAGLKDFDVWDYDKIRTLLDNNRDVATSYGAWITGGDVLAQIVAALDLQQPKFDVVMANFLQKELTSDLNANLQQAGYIAKAPVPLSAVFIDLLTSDRRLYESPDESKPLEPGFIAEILRASILKLDPETLSTGLRDITRGDQRAGRYVLIGGPGQGKTTLGQYICQLFRTALLQDRPRLSPDVKRTIEKIKSESLADRLPLPTTRRFPIRVVLSDFAKSLATQLGGSSSLVSFPRSFSILASFDSTILSSTNIRYIQRTISTSSCGPGTRITLSV